MSEKKTLTWRRNTGTGNYVAIDLDHDPAAVYSVGRNDMRPAGHQWYIEQWFADDVTTVQKRDNFSTMALAKAAATATHCFKCGRWMDFCDVESLGSEPRSMYQSRSWRCRDTGPCEAEAARIRAIEKEALKRRDHNVFEIRETEYGPDLVVGEQHLNTLTGRMDGNSTVIGCTEADLDRIEAMIRERREARKHVCRVGCEHDPGDGHSAAGFARNH